MWVLFCSSSASLPACRLCFHFIVWFSPNLSFDHWSIQRPGLKPTSASSCFQLIQVNYPDHFGSSSKNSTPGPSSPGWPQVWICPVSYQRESNIIEAHLQLWQHGKSSGHIPGTVLGKSGTQKKAILHREELGQNLVAFRGCVLFLPFLSFLSSNHTKILRESGGIAKICNLDLKIPDNQPEFSGETEGVVGCLVWWRVWLM